MAPFTSCNSSTQTLKCLVLPPTRKWLPLPCLTHPTPLHPTLKRLPPLPLASEILLDSDDNYTQDNGSLSATAFWHAVSWHLEPSFSLSEELTLSRLQTAWSRSFISFTFCSERHFRCKRCSANTWRKTNSQLLFQWTHLLHCTRGLGVPNAILLASRQHINISCVLCSPVIGTESHFSKPYSPLPHTQQPPNRQLCTLHCMEHGFRLHCSVLMCRFSCRLCSRPGSWAAELLLTLQYSLSHHLLGEVLCMGRGTGQAFLHLFGFFSISPKELQQYCHYLF